MDTTTDPRALPKRGNFLWRAIKAIGNGFLLLIGTLYFPLELVSIFEFDTSLSEVSLIEAAYVFTAMILMKDYYNTGREHHLSRWKLFSQLVKSFGWLTLITLAIYTVLIFSFGENVVITPEVEFITNLIFRILVLLLIIYWTSISKNGPKSFVTDSTIKSQITGNPA